MTTRRVIPVTRFAPISSRLDTPTLPRLLNSTEVPKLSKEQLNKRRSDVIKYYNELSRKKTSPIDKTVKTGKRIEEEKKEAKRVEPQLKQARNVNRSPMAKTKNFDRGDMPSVPEHPVEETWEQLQELTQRLLEMRPCHQISPKQVEKHVEDVRKLINISVAIIGAGFAGLRAAQRFEETGVNYIVFEGSNRIGGRVFPFSYGNGYLQFGAEYVNGEQNEIYEIMKRNQLESKEELSDDGYETVVDGREVNEQLQEQWDSFESSTNSKIERDSQKIQNQSVSERIDFYYDTFVKNKKFTSLEGKTIESMKKLFKNQFQIEWSSPVEDLCLKNFDTWDSGKSDKEFTLNRFGFKTILDEMMAKIPGDKIWMNSKVVSIDYTGPKVKLTLSNGSSFSFDSVIVTSSLGFLKANHKKMFIPNVSLEKSAAIERFGYGSNMKVFLEYEKPWWPRGMSAVQIVTNQTSPLKSNLMVFQRSLWAENILVAWIGGNGPAEVAKLTDNQLISVINDHLTENLKGIYKVSKIGKIYRHDWISDEFSLGSYSYISTETCAANKKDIHILGDVIQTNGRLAICFAGEHTDPSMYQTVVGAARSGLREANRILNFYSSQ